MKEVEIKSVQRTVEYIGRNCNKEVKNHAVVRNHISHLPPTRLKRFKIFKCVKNIKCSFFKSAWGATV